MFETLDGSEYTPERATTLSAGHDLRSTVDVMLMPHSVTKVPTGIRQVSDVRRWFKIEGRSGLASKGIFPTRAVVGEEDFWPVGGVIDADYRGEWIVLLYNSTGNPHMIFKGDKIAQFVVHQLIVLGRVVSEEARGTGGFGSSDSNKG